MRATEERHMNESAQASAPDTSGRRYPANLPHARHAFIIIAHRGDHVQAPENSLEALDSAISHGADYVELDLRTSRDGGLFIMHDEKIDRTTTGKGPLSDLASQELDTCHLRQSHETIPRLETFLEKCAGRVNIYLDFKAAEVSRVVKVLAAHQALGSVIVYINEPQQYLDWRKWSPSTPLIVSLPPGIGTPDQMQAFLERYPAEVLDGDFSEYTPELVDRARKLGVMVWPDIQSANEEVNWAKAVRTGFTGLQTDHPEALAKWLASEGKR